MNVDPRIELSITCTVAEWQRLIDLLEIAASDVNNKQLAIKLSKASLDIFGDIPQLSCFDDLQNEKHL